MRAIGDQGRYPWSLEQPQGDGTAGVQTLGRAILTELPIDWIARLR
jgi:hypothetical protein